MLVRRSSYGVTTGGRSSPLATRHRSSSPSIMPGASTAHVHTLSLLAAPPYPNGYYVCHVCWERGSGPLYHCRDCQLDLHVSCVGVGSQQTHPLHYQHPLHLKAVVGPAGRHVCDGCGEPLMASAYRCGSCDFDLCQLCVRAPRFLLHVSHPHVLVRSRVGELRGSCECDGCGTLASGMVYRCTSCNFDLHQSCVTLPLKPIHPRHPEHPLTLLCRQEITSYTCEFCQRDGRGWAYTCSICRFYVHPTCAKILHEVPHSTTMQTLRQELVVTPRADTYGTWYDYEDDDLIVNSYNERYPLSPPSHMYQQRAYHPSIAQPISPYPYNSSSLDSPRIYTPRLSSLSSPRDYLDENDVPSDSIVQALHRLTPSLSPRDVAAVDRVVDLFRNRRGSLY